METKTISDCLSTIDFAIVENVRLLGIKNLEDIHNHLLEFRQTEYIENSVALLKVLKHINCIKDNFSSYEDDESFYNEYVELRKLIVNWLIECNTKPEVNNQSNKKIL